MQRLTALASELCALHQTSDDTSGCEYPAGGFDNPTNAAMAKTILARNVSRSRTATGIPVESMTPVNHSNIGGGIMPKLQVLYGLWLKFPLPLVRYLGGSGTAQIQLAGIAGSAVAHLRSVASLVFDEGRSM